MPEINYKVIAIKKEPYRLFLISNENSFNHFVIK